MGRVSMDVPPQLQALNQWVTWKYIGDDRRKVPYQINGLPAKSNDPETWTTFGYASKSGHNLGFVFAPDDGLFGIDLDGCISADGELQAWAQEIVDRFGTYAEVSPSGHGVKLWGIGAMPGGSGKKTSVDAPRCCDKQPAIEAYDRGRYFTFTGERLPTSPLDVVECQAALDWLVAKYWPPMMVPTARQSTPITERAARYLAEIPPAISGQGGHNQTFRAACVLVVGFNLSVDDALPLLAEWNTRCQPPWTEKELLHKLESADKQPGERGEMLRSDYLAGPAVDISGVMACQDTAIVPVCVDEDDELCEDDSLVENDGGPFPIECSRPEGLIRDVIEFNERRSRYFQPEAALASALCLMSVLTGRKIRDSENTRTNLYVMALCPTGGGKELGRTINKDILLACGAEELIGPEDFASAAGAMSWMSDHPVTLSQMDEIGRTIATTKDAGKSPHLFKLVSVFLKLFTQSNTIISGDAYADKQKHKKLYFPHLTIYGTSTVKAFWDSITAESISDGLVGRFIIFDRTITDEDKNKKGYVKPKKPDALCEVPESIVERARWWWQFIAGSGNLSSVNPSPVTIPLSKEAEERFENHALAVAEKRLGNESDVASALWSRSAEKVAKLALLFACSRSSFELPSCVSFDDVDKAIRLSNWATRRMLFMIGSHVCESKYDADRKRVLRLFGDKPLTKTQLTRMCHWLEPRMRATIISDLIESRLISAREVQGKTKTATVFEKATRKLAAKA